MAQLYDNVETFLWTPVPTFNFHSNTVNQVVRVADLLIVSDQVGFLLIYAKGVVGNLQCGESQLCVPDCELCVLGRDYSLSAII